MYGKNTETNEICRLISFLKLFVVYGQQHLTMIYDQSLQTYRKKCKKPYRVFVIFNFNRPIVVIPPL